MTLETLEDRYDMEVAVDDDSFLGDPFVLKGNWRLESKFSYKGVLYLASHRKRFERVTVVRATWGATIDGNGIH